MQHVSDFLTYSERSAANCNRDPYPVLAKFDRVRASRDRITKQLQNPDLPDAQRGELEMRRAKADQLLRSVDAHRQSFTQSRLLAELRPL